MKYVIFPAFHEWQIDPTRLVGFYPFHHGWQQSNSNLLRSSSSSSRSFRFKKVTTRGGKYSMVSDRAVFVHKHYLQYIPPTPPDQCQHLALSIVVSAMTSQSPVAVFSKPHTVRSSPKTFESLDDTDDLESSCQKWVETLGVEELPDQTATFVGQR